MLDLKCPNCGATITLDDTREFGFCSYCGTKLQVVQKVKVVHEGTINVAGIQNDEQQLNSAKKLIELGEKGKAKELLEKIVTSSPECAEAWIMLATLKYCRTLAECLGSSIGLNANEGKQKLLNALISSSEMKNAQSILGTNNAYYNKVIEDYKKTIDEAITNSKNIINKYCNNPQLLSGYGYYDEGYEYGFFTHNGELYLDTGNIKRVSSISNGTISLELEYTNCFGHNEISPRSKYTTRSILFANENLIIIGGSTNTYCKSSDRASKIENKLLNKIRIRKNNFKCIICGADKSLLGCKARCRSFIR